MVVQVSQHIESGRVVQAVSNAHPAQNALEIPPLTHHEASVLMAEEAKRTLSLFASLSGDDWSQPTACTLWNVHEVASHLVGESAGYASWGQFYRLFLNIFNKRGYFRKGMDLLDALNQMMVDDRANHTPAELIAELREAAPKAIKMRLDLPAWLRAVVMPIPALGTVRLDYLTDTIYPRDTWMHRVDISRAAGKELVFDSAHDARIIELAIRELAQITQAHLGDESIVLRLDTQAGGEWLIGKNPMDSAQIECGLIDFMLLVSGRIKPDEALKHARIHGDQSLGTRFIQNVVVPF